MHIALPCRTRRGSSILVVGLCLSLQCACGISPLHPSPQAHLQAPASPTTPLANPATPALPATAATTVQEETYSVSVHQVPVQDLLFALARDAKLNVDIHPGLEGRVTLNAINQTLPQLLARIARQVEVRFEQEGANLAVMPDHPFLKHYKVDYVNLSRQITGTVATSTQIASDPNRDATTLGNGNISSTRVENLSQHHFWTSLEHNIKDILRETDKLLPPGAVAAAAPPPQEVSSRPPPQGTPAPLSPPRSTPESPRPQFREAASVIVNAETGIVAVRATGRQHERIATFIRQVGQAARRQVMIEATIVEVELSEGYQQGIEWSRVWSGAGKEFRVTPTTATGGATPSLTPFVIDYRNLVNPLSITLNLLQSFGTTKVLSSPRLSVLNNQTALLKVVENVVYFNIKAEVTPGNSNTNPLVAYSTTPQTVSVGLVMTVTPQIGDNDSIILNVRPTISSIAGMVKDPNPDIPSHIANEIPQIRTREIESVLRLSSGEIAVLGGLMEDRLDYRKGQVPLLGRIPLLGELFTARNDATRKSELVIFLRPMVSPLDQAGTAHAALSPHLPDADFFTPATPGNGSIP